MTGYRIFLDELQISDRPACSWKWPLTRRMIRYAARSPSDRCPGRLPAQPRGCRRTIRGQTSPDGEGSVGKTLVAALKDALFTEGCISLTASKSRQPASAIPAVSRPRSSRQDPTDLCKFAELFGHWIMTERTREFGRIIGASANPDAAVLARRIGR